MGHGKIVARVWVGYDLCVPVASVGVLDRLDLIHRRHPVRLAKMKTDWTGNLVCFIEVPLDIGAVVGSRGIDAVPRRC